jgi:ribose 5-phosphate isomerase A
MYTMLSAKDIKKKVGEFAAQLVENNMTIGIGTGTTAYWLIMSLGEKIKNGLQIRAVPTSRQTEQLARENNILLVQLNDVDKLDLVIDGADEIDPQLQLIKGGGGALLQEKMVAAAGEKVVIIADESKLVNTLGKFPLPVEVIPFGWKQVQKHIHRLGCQQIILRTKNDDPFITDHGHYILDCYFREIEDAPSLSNALHNIPGVVENGLFINMATETIAGYSDGTVKTIYPQ